MAKVGQPGFAFEESHQGFIRGFRRRFCQGSPEHRCARADLELLQTARYGLADPRVFSGTLEAPGRVVTLLRGGPDEVVHGMLYRVRAELAEEVMGQLLHREKAGYDLAEVVVHCADGVARPAQVFWATPANEFFVGEDAEPLERTAEIIAQSRGQSGPNIEYFDRLLEALRTWGVHEPYMDQLADLVDARRSASVVASSPCG